LRVLPHLHERGAGDDVLADHARDRHGHASGGRGGDQSLGMDGLQIAGAVRRDLDCPLGWRRAWLGGHADRRQVAVDDLERGALDLAHDLVDLDRVGQMMHEEHQQQQADEEQQQCDGDRESRVLVGPFAGLHPDRVEARAAVDEGRHEDAQHELVDPVTQEVAEQPGGELGRSELEGHHGKTEHQRDHGGHRAGDRDQQGPGVVSGALEQKAVPPRPRPHLDERQTRTGDQGDHDRDRRQRPEGSAQVLACRFPPHCAIPSLWSGSRRVPRWSTV
jgi:hypothetical protein